MLLIKNKNKISLDLMRKWGIIFTNLDNMQSEIEKKGERFQILW